MQNQKGKGNETTYPITEKRGNAGSPRTNQVLNPPLSDRFRIPPISSYDGKEDPFIHIEDFQTHPSFYNLSDGVACQVFPLTLREEAREWFDNLDSIDSFNTIKHQFLDRFSKRRQHPTSLFSLKQGQTKSLTSFVRRFN